MKRIYFFVVCLCAVFTGVYLISCDKDDNNSNGNNTLVGTWCLDQEDSGSYYSDENEYHEYLAFFSDGTGFFYEIEYSGSDYPCFDEVEKFTYEYNEKDMTLEIEEIEYGDSYGSGSYKDKEIWDVITLSNNKLILMGYDGSNPNEIVVFRKVNAPVTRQELEREANDDSSSSYYY